MTFNMQGISSHKTLRPVQLRVTSRSRPPAHVMIYHVEGLIEFWKNADVCTDSTEKMFPQWESCSSSGMHSRPETDQLACPWSHSPRFWSTSTTSDGSNLIIQHIATLISNGLTVTEISSAERMEKVSFGLSRRVWKRKRRYDGSVAIILNVS